LVDEQEGVSRHWEVRHRVAFHPGDVLEELADLGGAHLPGRHLP
jgi:hypothetical protein